MNLIENLLETCRRDLAALSARPMPLQMPMPVGVPTAMAHAGVQPMSSGQWPSQVVECVLTISGNQI